jgi:hypothetical protein
MDTDDFFIRNRLQSERVCVAEVTLPGERELFEIFLRLDLFDVDAFELIFVETFARSQVAQLLLDQIELGFCHFHGGLYPFILSLGRDFLKKVPPQTPLQKLSVK